MRNVLLLLVAVLAIAASPVHAQAPQATPAPFTLAPLPYPADALAPVIDAETMSIHHGKHHQAYVDNLNTAVAADPALQGVTIEALMARVSTLPPAVRDNGGGHWNHTFFWTTMTRPNQGGAPSAELAAAIDRRFGSLQQMQQAFNEAGTRRFGSGWAWLVVTPAGDLAVTSTPNQDNPLMDVAESKGTPILGNDVWEHAYYLTYRNRRAEYLKAWWQVVDWAEVSRRYAEAVKR